MTTNHLSTIIKTHTGFETITGYRLYLLQLHSDFLKSGHEATAQDYAAFANVILALVGEAVPSTPEDPQLTCAFSHYTRE